LSKKTHKVVVAMSGGVDSSVAASLLAAQGYEVVGVFLRTGVAKSPGDTPHANEEGLVYVDRPEDREARYINCHHYCNLPDAADARAVAQKLGIAFDVVDLWPQFERIIDYFADEYLRGRTPNPCVMCNQQLKFAKLDEYAQQIGADFIATGHYARVDRQDGICRLRRGVDRSKDQSYVLVRVNPDVLSRTLLPIGERTKDEVRDHAQKLDLRVWDKPDSQDICFAGDRDYAGIVRERRPEAFVEGPIVDTAGNEVGRHQGLANFTIGQRRGVGIAMGEPVYVVRLDVTHNTVVIGSRQDLASDSLDASDVCWLIDPPRKPIRGEVQIRYAHKAAPATIEPMTADSVKVRFDAPQSAITPGQAAVFYDGDVVLGGGWID